jgi:small subunit ribosomal protein S16
MVRIRLRRVGAKKQPHYRVVVADQHHPRDGRHIEVIGHYNPRTKPVTLEIKEDRALYWLSQGAQPSDPVQRFLEKQGTLARLARLKAGESFDALLAEYEAGDVIEEPVVEEVEESVADAAEEPVAEAAEEPVTEAAEEPVAEAAEEPVAGAAEEPVTEATEEPVAEAAEEPVAEAAEEPVAEAAEEPVAEIAEAKVAEVEETPEPDTEPQD